MKLKFLLACIICVCSSSLLHPIPWLLKFIYRVDTLEKDGKKIHLFYDRHDYVVRHAHEQAIVEVLAQQKGYVFVEDKSRHVGDKNIDNIETAITLSDGTEGTKQNSQGNLFGLVGRLQAAGISASTVECRRGISLLKDCEEAPDKFFKFMVDDYRKIVAGLKVAHPITSEEILINNAVEACQIREKLYLAGLEKKIIGSLVNVGAKTVDMLALKQLCTQGGSLLAGGWHCRNIESDLVNKLGWKRIKCIDTSVKVAAIEGLIHKMPLFPEQIKNYFKVPGTHKQPDRA